MGEWGIHYLCCKLLHIPFSECGSWRESPLETGVREIHEQVHV
uniref:Uncharacterized protein n=1 Tax=Anguilla anguilla TaxID=7936 RepID=A0A0E9RAV4_ANGAN